MFHFKTQWWTHLSFCLTIRLLLVVQEMGKAAAAISTNSLVFIFRVRPPFHSAALTSSYYYSTTRYCSRDNGETPYQLLKSVRD